tara:strand:- start:548 stop:958 length:411 start_codon:yes stop_codon:yes gene_type:complete
MAFKENSLVRIVRPPAGMNALQNLIGFVNYNPPIECEDPQIEIAILDDTGLREIYMLPEAALILDETEEATRLYSQYQNSLQEIERESKERQKRRTAVTNYLARKYGITPDEIYGVYKAMLNYENYYEEYVKRTPH